MNEDQHKNEKVRKSTQATRARRKRQKSRLQSENKRLREAAAAALERCEVATDPSGAADEAAAILRQVVTLSGEYRPPLPISAVIDGRREPA